MRPLRSLNVTLYADYMGEKDRRVRCSPNFSSGLIADPRNPQWAEADYTGRSPKHGCIADRRCLALALNRLYISGSLHRQGRFQSGKFNMRYLIYQFFHLHSIRHIYFFTVEYEGNFFL